MVFGILLAMFQPTINGSAELGDFEWRSILFRFFIFAPICFIAFALLVLLFKLARIFCRWLFSWRVLKWVLLAFAFLMVVVALFYVEENWRGRRAWENYKHEWETKGEKFDFASFIPPPVPDDQNFALTPVVASGYSRFMDKNGHKISPENTNVVNRLDMKLDRQNLQMTTNLDFGRWQKGGFTDLKSWQTYFRTMFVTNRWEMGMPPPPGIGFPGQLPSGAEMPAGSDSLPPQPIQVDTNMTEEVIALATNEFPVAPQPQSPAADVLLALSKFDSAIEDLRQASRLPHSRFPLAYDEEMPAEILLPHLGSLKSCSQILQLRAIAELSDGKTENAFDDVKLILYLASSIRDEPFQICLQVRVFIFGRAMQAIWEGLAEHKWSDVQLAELNRELAGLDFPSDCDTAVRGNRAADLKIIDHARRTHNAGVIPFLYGEESYDLRTRLILLYFHLFPSGWFYQNDLAFARAMQQQLRTDDEVKRRILSPDIVRRSGDASAEMGSHDNSPYYYFVRMLLPAFGNAARTFAFTQASVDLARTASALERYYLAHGAYPENLDALSPQFIETIPHDVINGQPLHYCRTEDGRFLLYSIGWNETDDGGTIVLGTSGRLVDIRKGDWVWQYPSK